VVQARKREGKKREPFPLPFPGKRDRKSLGTFLFPSLIWLAAGKMPFLTKMRDFQKI
jgi:hypothetical protein